jgi:HAD superfamily hydrolase (TIGR01509 family)
MKVDLPARLNNMNAKMNYAVIFDLDGVVADTEPLKAEAHARTARSFGGHLPENFYPQVLGHPQNEVAKAAIIRANLSIELPTYNAAFFELYLKAVHSEVIAVPGVIDTMKNLIEHSFGLGLVTSSPKWMMRAVLERLNISNLLHIAISADDVSHPKPSSECYELALSKLQLPPSAVIAIEDTDLGGWAAKRASIVTIGCRHKLARLQVFDFADMVIAPPFDSVEFLCVVENCLTGQRGIAR